jgi:hypothetical protein
MKTCRTCGAAAAMACLLALPALFLLSCGPRAVGYGVILWGDPSGQAATGAVVGILKRSDIDNSIIVSVPGERKPREYPAGRIRGFERRVEAVQYAASYASFLGTWAFSQKLDPPPLPVRDQPRQEGRAIYKLKPGQLVKVVGRSANPEAVKPYEDYWYEVVTEDGYSGFCFGHFLKVFRTAGDPAAEAARIMSQDETLDRILGSTWRPDWFLDSIASGSIDLTRFREDVGLFSTPADKLFHLTMPQYSVDFRYDRIDRVAQDTYVAVGTSLRITALTDERISITYRYKDQEMGALFVIVKDDVAEVIAREQKRRQDIFDGLRAKGPALASSAYGSIRLEDGMRFSWQGFQRLVPSVIPRRAAGKGRIDFSYRPAREVAGEYDGVITFVFDDSDGAPAAGAPSASFLYKAVQGGVRFTSLDRDSLADPAAIRPGLSPVVIYFARGTAP